MKKETLAQILTYSGSIPFIFFSYLIFIEDTLFFGIETKSILVGYAAIIISFISGIHFSYGINQNKISIQLLLFSNLIALTAWISLFVNFEIALAIILACYLTNLFVDYYALQKNIIEEWFFKLRLKITMIVMLCLSLNYLHIF